MNEFDVPDAGEGDVAPRPDRDRRRLLGLLRAVLIIGLVCLFLYAVWLGSWYGILAWVLTVIVMLDTSVNVLFALYDVPGARRHGWVFWLATVFWNTHSIQMVRKDGTVKVVRPPGPLASLFARLGGPAIVYIDNGMAAVFERNGRFTRVSGPGRIFARRFERVAYVVDLRRQLRSREVSKIMTRDGLSFDLNRLDVLFEVASDFDPKRGEHSFSEQALMDLVYRGGFLYKEKGEKIEWGSRVVGIVEYYLRRVAASYPLENVARLRAGSARQQFMLKVERLARPALEEMGVRLLGIDLGQVILPKEMEDLLTLDIRQRVDLGWAQTHRDTIVSVAGGLAEAIGEIQEELRKEGGGREAMQVLLVNLTSILEQISSQFLRLAGPYRASPEVQRLLAAGQEEPPGGEQH